MFATMSCGVFGAARYDSIRSIVSEDSDTKQKGFGGRHAWKSRRVAGPVLPESMQGMQAAGSVWRSSGLATMCLLRLPKYGFPSTSSSLSSPRCPLPLPWTTSPMAPLQSSP